MNEFKPSSWQKEPQDLAKEFTAWEDAQSAPNEVQTAPEGFSKQLVRRGVLDPCTGLATGSMKQRHLSAWVPSKNFQDNYERAFGHA